MANKDRPRGFVPKGKVLQQLVTVAGGTIYPGDWVKLQSDGTVVVVAAGNDIYGNSLSYATTGQKVLLSVAPEQLYVGQADETELDAQTDIGNLCDVVATAGSSTYKASRMEIDSSTVGTGAGGQLCIVGFAARPDTAAGTNADVIVKINEHQMFGTDDFAGI